MLDFRTELQPMWLNKQNTSATKPYHFVIRRMRGIDLQGTIWEAGGGQLLFPEERG